MNEKPQQFEIRPARRSDVPIILELIRALAAYERVPNDVTATEVELSLLRSVSFPFGVALFAVAKKPTVGSRDGT